MNRRAKQSRASVDQALSRLADQGVIRCLTRGLYDYPKKSPRFGYLSTSADNVAQAVARKATRACSPPPPWRPISWDTQLRCRPSLSI